MSVNRAYAATVNIIGEAQREKLRAVLAEYMMGLARTGERDGQRLCGLSVLAVLGRAPEHKPSRAALQHTCWRS